MDLLLESVQNAYISGGITESEYTSLMSTIEENAVSSPVVKSIKDLMESIKRTISSLKNKKPKDDNEKKLIDKTIKYQELELKRLGDSVSLSNDPDNMSSMNSDLLQKVGHKIATESTGLDVISSHIFEAFNNGEITYDEKNDLLIQLVEGYNYK